MQFYQGHQTNYTYSAAGAKLKVIDKTAPAGAELPITSLNSILTNPSVSFTTTSDYVGNVIYENGTLKRILTPVGYWQAGTFYYFLKDHLGSNRVVINGSGGIAETSSYYPSGMRFGESAVNGGSVQPYRHTGHEMQEMHGLNWVDNLARFRTVSDGSGFTGVDLLCEKYYSISPYSYCAGNPVNRVDPDGRDWFVNNKNGNVIFLRGVHELSNKLREKYGLGKGKYEDLGKDNMFGKNLKEIKNRDVLTFDGPKYAEKFMNKQGYAQAERSKVEETKITMTDSGENGKIIKNSVFDLVEKDKSTTYVTPEKLNTKSDMLTKKVGDIYRQFNEIETVKYDLIKPVGQSPYENAFYENQRSVEKLNNTIDGVGLIFKLLEIGL